MKTILILALTALPFLAMFGCSTTEPRDSLIVSTAFRYTLVRYIDQADSPLHRAAEIAEGAESLLGIINDKEMVTVASIEQYVRERMGYSTKPLHERLLVDDLIRAVKVSLEEAADGADLGPDTELRLVRVISTARATARSYLNTLSD